MEENMDRLKSFIKGCFASKTVCADLQTDHYYIWEPTDTFTRVPIEYPHNTIDKDKLEFLVHHCQKALPWSLPKHKIILVIPENTAGDEIHRFETAIFKNGGNRFRDMKFISDALCVMSVFNFSGKSLYFFSTNHMIGGFGGFLGEPITQVLYFPSDTGFDELVREVSLKMPSTIPDHFLKDPYMRYLTEKQIDIQKEWNTFHIHSSLDPDMISLCSSVHNNDVQNKYDKEVVLTGVMDMIRRKKES